jgi:signal transduction histidine kinase
MTCRRRRTASIPRSWPGAASRQRSRRSRAARALPSSSTCGLRRLADQVEVAAYYVVSEALTNAAKHAQASVVHVDAEAVEGALRLCVRDDGAGGADPARGSGLVGLKDRVEALGGSIAVQSPVGAGTTLHAELPLAR